MKKLFIALVLIAVSATVGFAQDRVNVQVQFRKALWSCPSGNEITDLNVGTPSVYEHTCSDGTWLNSFKEYNGVLTYTPEEFEKADSKEKDTAKDKLVNDWLYQVKNPPVYIEPTPEDLQKEIDSKTQEIQEITARKVEAIAKMEAQPIKENEETIIAR